MGSNAKITNLILEAFDITGHQVIGTLAARMRGHNILIENIKVNTKIIASSTPIGGLIGQAATLTGNTTISSITINGSVTGHKNVGGLIGYLIDYTGQHMIENIQINAHVNGISTQTDFSQFGGLIGNVQNSNTDYITINQISHHGDVTGRDEVGGIIGTINEANVILSNVYSSGTLTASGDGVGGLVGELRSRLTRGRLELINGYSVSVISGTAPNPGTIIGDVQSSESIIGPLQVVTLSGVYYIEGTNLNTIGISESSLTISGSAIERTQAQMKERDTFEGWNFDTIWAIDPARNNGYPYLKFEE